MGQYVYGYAWKDNEGIVHKNFIYAESKEEADKEFEELTKISLTDKKIKVSRARRRA